MVYNTAEMNTHVQCSRTPQRREIIGNQVGNLSDPVTVSEEFAANAIAKARRRGGWRRASQETCWMWCGWVSSAERDLSGTCPPLYSGGLRFGVFGTCSLGAGPFLR